MKKAIILALMILPLLQISCRKSNKPSPIKAATYVESSPMKGRSSITFHNGFSFTVQDLRVTPAAKFEYKYRLEDGNMILTPPIVDAYIPSPVTYQISTNGELIVNPFRPNLWQEKIAYISFTKQ